jgi:hypothetical protein
VKIRVTKTTIGDDKMNAATQKAYSAWGGQANTAISQGFYPETSYDDVTVFRSPYYHAFNNVVIPNSKDLGHIAFLGHNNQTFDIVIRDKTGNIVHYINKGLSPDQVQQYLTNQRSTVAQRNNSILQGANTDKDNNLVVKK